MLKHALLGAPAVLCLLVRSSLQHQALFLIVLAVFVSLSPSLLVTGLLRSTLYRQHFPKPQTLFRTGVPQASSHRIDHRRVELGPWSMTAAVLLSVMPFAVAAAAACAKIRGRVRFTTSSRQHNVTPKSFVTSLFKKA